MEGLLIPAFVAGILMFLAPCTLPLVPGYLAFVSGTSLTGLDDPARRRAIRRKIFRNGVFYVLGFSVVFILLGSVFSGVAGLASPGIRMALARVGGFFVLFLGLYMMGVFRHVPFLRALESDRRIPVARHLTPGKPLSSFLFGATFALGWTPCIGPILGSILLIAAASATVVEGMLLLAVFSLGLALPFLLLALAIGQATRIIHGVSRALPAIQMIGGLLIAFLGLLMLFNVMHIWSAWILQGFGFIRYERLLDFL